MLACITSVDSKSASTNLQTSVIRNLAEWLSANRWHPSLTVFYDLCSQGMPGESHRAPLYMNGKERGRGRETQIAQPDILVRHETAHTVELIVEVDFRTNRNGCLEAPHPKGLTGLFLTSAAADIHAPSNDYRTTYELRNTLIVVVTAYSNSDRLRHDQNFANELFRRFHVAERGVRELCICGGATQDEIEYSFQESMRTKFTIAQSGQ